MILKHPMVFFTSIFNWFKEVFLELDATRTKDMCIDFRRKHPALAITTIKGQDVDSIESYKYFGIVTENKRTFDSEKPASFFVW